MKCPQCQVDNPEESQFCAKCGIQLSKPDEPAAIPTQTMQSVVTELETGTNFAGRYQIVEELGRGGMGRVYKVMDTELKEKIALKLLKPQIAADEDTIERFRNELKTARNVTHKNICRMYDLGKFEGNYYITMEYVSGEDLKSMLGMMGKLGPAKTVSIGIQICDGLLEAHKRGVVHRDLKPQNIMIDREGKIRIMDFGIARSLKSKGITGAGVMIGTPEYMSPEQAEAKEVDRRSDIYSLGIILYELATGQLPFTGDTHLSVAMKHKGEIPKNPQELNPQIGDDLNLLILKCLAKDKEDRYPNVAALKSELERIEQGLPTTETLVSKRPTSTSRQITVTFGPRKLLLPVLIAVGILAAILIWQLLSRKDLLPVSGDKPSLAIMYFENGTGDESYDHWKRGLACLLISDLQQSKYVDVLSADRLFSLMKDLDLLESESYATEELRELANLGRNSHVLQGILTKAGNTFRINVSIQEADMGELIGSEEVEGQGEGSFYAMVDELTRRIKTHFPIPESLLVSDIDREIENITTSSPEAYKYYVEGRRLHHSANYIESISEMEKALEIDPEFAMAYRSIAVSFHNRGLLNKRREYLEKAMMYENRLSDRERFTIQGDYFSNSEKTVDKAIAAYRRVLVDYPEDSTCLHNLATQHEKLEDWENTAKYYGYCVKYESSFIPTYTQYTELMVSLARIDEAREVLNSYLEIYPEHVEIQYSSAYVYLARKEYDLAQQELDRARELDPENFLNTLNQAVLFHYKGKLDEAQKEYLKLADNPEPAAQYFPANGRMDIHLLTGQYGQARMIGNFAVSFAVQLGVNWAESEWRSQLAYLYLRSNDATQALKESERAWSVASEVGNYSRMRLALLFKGLSWIGLNDLEKAQVAGDELKAFIEKGHNPKKIRLFHFLQGRIEMAKGNWGKAIENLEQAASNRDLSSHHPAFSTSLNQHIWHLYALAYAYLQVQDYDKALEVCDRALGLNFNKIGYGDVFSKCHYLKGKIYQEQGLKDLAAASYEKFLDFWKDADPGLPESTDARSQLASLR
jgi:serine/threonine protein kinase/Tfp pilus assembly protein PilF